MNPDLNRIGEALALAERSGQFRQLEAVYAGIPEGQCAGCTQCCRESVNAFFVEFLNIHRYLEEKPELRARLMPRILTFYFLEMVQRTACPFLEPDGRCAIYEVRPLVCRQFGHWSRKDFEANLKAVAKANREAAAYYQKTYGLKLPEAVVTPSITYCESFTVSRKMSAARRNAQTDAVFMLDIPFLQAGLLQEDLLGTSLVTWFVYTVFNNAEAGALRLKVMKEFLDTGGSPTLEVLTSTS